MAGRAAGASPRVDDVICVVGRDPSGLTHASFGHVGLVAGEWRTWRGGRVDRLIRLDGGLYPGLDGAPVADASGQVLGAKPHMLRHAPVSEFGTVPVAEPRDQQPSCEVQGAAAPVRRARRPQVRVRPPRAAAFRQSAVVNLVDATAAMQRKEPVASTRFLAAQLHESWGRSAAVRVDRQAAHIGHPIAENDSREAVMAVQPRPRNQRGQPLHELHRRHHQVRGAVSPRGLQLSSTCNAALDCTSSSESAGRVM